MRRTALPLVAIGLLIPAVAHAQATVTVNLNAEGEQYATALGITPQDLADQVREDVDRAYQASNLKSFLRSFTDATAFSARGIGVDYGSVPTGFMAGIAANVAAAGDDDVFEDGRPTAGLAANVAVMLGLNLKNWDLPKWSFYVNGFYRKGSTDQLTGGITSAGAHVQYRIIEAANTDGASKAVRWLGLTLTSGIEFTRWNLETKPDGVETDVDIIGSGANADLVVSSTGRFDLTSTATTVPIEVTTGFRLAVLASVYFGVGTDLSVGESTVDAGLSGTITTNDNRDLGTVAVNGSGDGSASPAALRALVGAQLNLTALKIFAQANLSAVPAASIAFGLRFVL